MGDIIIGDTNMGDSSGDIIVGDTSIGDTSTDETIMMCWYLSFPVTGLHWDHLH